MREQFTFYRSYWEAIRRIRRKSDRLSALEAIIAYALDGTEPRLTYEAEGVFILARPTLDASRRKAECGARGGKAGAKQSESEAEAKRKRGAGKKENKKEDKIEDKKEKERENKCSLNVVDVVDGAHGSFRPGGGERRNDDRDDDREDDDNDALTKSAVCPVPWEADEGVLHPVVSAFCSRIAPSPSGTCLRELLGFSERLGEALTLRAIDAAVDAGARSWHYVRAVLRDWEMRGIRSVEELERQEAERSAKRRTADAPPEADRNAWMDEYL